VSERIAVLIPAFNAAPSVAEVVRQTAAQLPLVVVIDDGSSDGTGELARNAGAIVLTHDVNRGKGAALKTGFAWALEQGVDGVVTVDADGQHLPSEIPKIVQCHVDTGADLVIGGRAHLFEQMLPRRRHANRFSARAIAWAARVAISDSQSGFRYYSARLIRAVPLKADGFDLESEVIVRAGASGFKVETTPIELGFVDGLCTSHYKPVADTVRIAWTVFKTKYLDSGKR
jgi:glycosyltransferase involved in cell wall biosynthesis